jgi:type II secretory pathway component PulF
VIAVAALALLSFGMFAFVPRFRTLFGDLGIIDFPTLTRFAFFVSGTVLPIFMLLLLGIVITAAIVLAQRRAATGRLWLDKWKLRLPGVGQIVEKAALARFSGTLGLLLDSGVELPRAIRLASDGAGNRVVEHVLRNIASQVELGRSLSESMEKTGAMPPSLAWRVGAGEETGTLPESLIRLSRLYASQVDGLVTSLAGLVEPVLIVVIGAGIASLVLGMFLPLVGVIQALAGYSG